jgi:hypothetical protein
VSWNHNFEYLKIIRQEGLVFRGVCNGWLMGMCLLNSISNTWREQKLEGILVMQDPSGNLTEDEMDI